MNKFLPISLLIPLISPLLAQMPGMALPAVQVEKVSAGFDKIERRSIGLMEPINSIIVRTAVEGYLIESAVEEGSLVQKGDLLFRIDPVRYQAAVDQAQAALDQIDAKSAYAQSRYERLKQLVGTQASSKEDKETAHATLEELKATKLEAEANLTQAKKDLEDCSITAAITGRVGSFDLDTGNYINRGSKLAVITQIDPIYVRFPLSQSDVVGVFRGPREIPNAASVRLRTADGSDYPHIGTISVVDNQLEGSTDSYTLWAEFPNEKGRLTPLGIGALYVSLNDKTEVCMVPLTAVHYNEQGAYCYVLDDKNQVERRPIVIGSVQGRLQTVYTGLSEGETVISDGAHKTREGATVNPVISTINEVTHETSVMEETATYVTVAPVTTMQDSTILRSHGGRVESIRTVDITPQVQGELKEPQFKEGASVKKDQILFEIDSTRYQAAYNAQLARIDQLNIKIEDAQSKLDRQNYLMSKQATSQDEQESAQATLRDLTAQKVAAQALLAIAKDDLDRCTIKAPMDALIGRTLVTGGNYITSSSSIATLIQLSPIYVRFALSENEILSHYGNTARMKEEAQISIITATGERLPTAGSIAFADNIIHTGTDTQDCWAVFPNADRLIQPGGVVSVEISRKADIKVMSIPSEAMLSDNMGRFVYVMKEDRAIMKRILAGSPNDKGLVPVYYGLQEGENVLTSNQMKLDDGSLITTEATTTDK